uniref:Helicase ATP-binding domain-containing protein n=1 Tax=Branchiostoma floridae TaxID=7739 RepID=C3YWX0_BRAFL|eukprot:XP_002599352.1 hypothetical protein BRAFLDRAFT_64295 [Branchiostoma floridae]
MIPYIVLLVVPVLGRMSDQTECVRLLATQCFATLVRLMPLEAGIPNPPDMSADLIEKKAEERRFLEQLLDNSRVDNYLVPVPIQAELRKYQQAELRKYQQLLDNYLVPVPIQAELRKYQQAELRKYQQAELRKHQQVRTGTVLLDNYLVPVPIQAELRKYQQDGVNWLAFLNKYKLHGILCDDMGLGKTLQSLCIVAGDHYHRAAEYRKSRHADCAPLPSIVVCPPTLTGHWVYEVEKFVSLEHLNPLHYTGPPSERNRLVNPLHYTGPPSERNRLVNPLYYTGPPSERNRLVNLLHYTGPPSERNRLVNPLYYTGPPSERNRLVNLLHYTGPPSERNRLVNPLHYTGPPSERNRLVTPLHYTGPPSERNRLVNLLHYTGPPSERNRLVNPLHYTGPPSERNRLVNPLNYTGPPSERNRLVNPLHYTGPPSERNRLVNPLNYTGPPSERNRLVNPLHYTGPPSERNRLVNPLHYTGPPSERNRLVNPLNYTGPPSERNRLVTTPRTTRDPPPRETRPPSERNRLVNPLHYTGPPSERNRLVNPLHYTGPPSERNRLRSRVKKHNLVVVSYDIVRNDIDFFRTIQWNYCILDEGHIIKNGKTKISKAVKQLQANHRLILSGTPIQTLFMDKYVLAVPVCPHSSISSFIPSQSGALAMEALHRQVLPFLLRRMKEDVLQDLPPKIIQDYYCELSQLQVQLYEDFAKSQARKGVEDSITMATADEEEKPKRTTHIFQALQYLQKVCNHPKLVLSCSHPEFQQVALQLKAQQSSLDDIQHSAKLTALRQLLLDCGIGVPDSGQTSDLLSDAVVGQHRALVFCQLKSMLDILEKDLLKFNNDPSIDLLLLTTHVGGLGLNLTGADTVIFVEHDWNPMRDLQAMDRAHRLGQKKVVNVYRLVTQGTLEEKIMGLQKFKLNIANTVISQENSSLRSMGTDQLLGLFTLDERKEREEGGRTAGAGNAHGSGEGMKGVMEGLGELWDQAQYETEYDLGSFVQSLT